MPTRATDRKRLSEPRLGLGPRHIFVLNHVLDLTTHGDTEQRQEVNEQDWPVDGNVGRTGNGAEKRDPCRSRGCEPELEFRETTDERTEFFVVFRA